MRSKINSADVGVTSVLSLPLTDLVVLRSEISLMKKRKCRRRELYDLISMIVDLASRVELQHARIADAKALAVYNAFERGAYQLVSAER
jgi:hypothetical protein